jgi:hypothetical protein
VNIVKNNEVHISKQVEEKIWKVAVGSHPMAIRDSLLDFPLHPLLPFMVTMATPLHGN